jgi:hypothetical protein
MLSFDDEIPGWLGDRSPSGNDMAPRGTLKLMIRRQQQATLHNGVPLKGT